MSIDYTTPGPFTRLTAAQSGAVRSFPADVIALCRVAQCILIPPELVAGFGIPEDRLDERNIRPAADILDLAMRRDARPLDRPRAPTDRVVGTCRHFSVVSVALLRAHGFAARSRCGFATYFKPERRVDHWVTEYLHDGRWIRVDSEILGFEFVPNPENLAPGEFLSGGEAWTECTSGEADPATFGVDGTDHAWGIAEIRGNAIRDLAALNKIETLPWDEWGRMRASYEGATDADFDALIGEIADATARRDPDGAAQLYATHDLAVPADLLT